eukprot:TRINITY_DN3071_c0_g1_i2.p1 TRINITY_DN3071_c0_g1~~TRINITY_DN3071_c0_g1_i2.p1  ORF type:complete len:748 (-),score=81.43 TRINITY_DN3071_c0_g1_i2:3969-6212(-)
MEKFSFNINSEPVVATKGQTILEAAREAGIYIPTLCYLPKLEPISSCRLCVVEIEGQDGFVLSCQTPAVEGIEVKVDSEALKEYRAQIMKFYCINHPLECGVCDQSGECGLQNMTLELGVDTQEFMAKEKKRDLSDWGFLQYDESLCILCERCVHTCNEIIGDDAIKISYGGFSSKIVPNNGESLECSDCGECAEVCPVGAIIVKDFQYSANAWELKKIDSTCAHCSNGCYMEYEIKPEGALDKSEYKIYRTSSDTDFSYLCGAGRFGYDFENRASRDDSAFRNALEAFKKADTISFESYITNEEALILQNLKEKLGVKLVNKDAYAYKRFLDEFGLISKKTLYSGSLEDIKNSSLIVQIGSRSRDVAPGVRYSINEAIKKEGAFFIDAHPVEDSSIEKSMHIKYEAGCEEALVALIAKAVVSKDSSAKSFFDSLDDGYLLAEANISEKEIERVEKEYAKKSHKTLIIGSDLYTHKRSTNIAKLVGLIEAHSDFKVILIPTSTNTLGVSLICDLDEKEGSYTIGYNTEGDFKLSSLGDGDLDMPALNQQEGTFTNIDKRVVKINPALPFKGYELNDIAKALGLKNKNTIDYTKELPESRGYKSIEFDSLPNNFLNDGKENRGYLLQNIDITNESNSTLEPIEELEEYNGTIIYLSNPILQFNRYSAKASEIATEPCIYISKPLAEEKELSSGDMVAIERDGVALSLECKIDETLGNSVVLVPDFIQSKDVDTLFKEGRYIKADIRKV